MIADLLHRISFIEKAGTGIRRIRNDTIAQGCPEPEFDVNGFFTATFGPNPTVRGELDGHSQKEATVQETTEKPMQATKEIMMLQAISGEMTRQKIQTVLRLKHYDHFRTTYLLSGQWIVLL